jgi:hypothetical protein
MLWKLEFMTSWSGKNEKKNDDEAFYSTSY